MSLFAYTVVQGAAYTILYHITHIAQAAAHNVSNMIK
jgi:hypothetical protein